MSMEFPGVALITGAGGTGIGNAVAHAFARAGCNKIVITDINPSTLHNTETSLRESTALPLDILAVAGDISDAAFIKDLFEKIRSYFGHIDYAVNAAGIIGDNCTTDESTIEAFDKVNGVNYRGLWMCVQEELRIMKEQDISQEGVRGQRGSIVNIASQLGVVGRPKAPAYCAGKAAVIGLTRCDAIDASPYRIRVNAVCPGIIDTPMVKPGKDAMSAPTAPSNVKVMDLSKSIAIAPMDRMGTADEIADVVLFLSSEKASFVQGAAWVVDGGYTIN